MPNNTSNINVPKIGMNTDSHDLNMEKGQYNFALNAAIEDFNGNGLPQLQNDPSNILANTFPEGFKVIGRKAIHEINKTIYALVNTNTGASEFGEVSECFYDDDKEDLVATDSDCEAGGEAYQERLPLEKVEQVPYCSYRTITNDDCLNFDIDFPVNIEYKLTNKGVNIYFVDYHNPNRFIYFDYDANRNLVLQDRFKVISGYDDENCNNPIYENKLDCNKIRYNPLYSRPCIEFVDDVSGGSIPAGSYQALAAYADVNGNALTQYFPATGHIPIKTKDITTETNYVTDRALVFKINNLEQSNVYGYYNLVIAQTVDNYTSFRLVATLPITQDTYTYTGNENDYKDITAQDVFFQRPIYTTAASITKANDYLFFGRLKEAKQMNLQPVANRVKLYWQTKAIPEKELKDPRNSEKYRGFLRDEVYPLGLVFEIDGENDTIAFHIPGPSKEYFQSTYNFNVDQLVTNNDVIPDTDCVEGNTINRYWQLYNTAKTIGTPHQFVRGCEDESYWEWGDFSYWESTRLYPNNAEIWGELCGQPIRHHKFPDSTISHIHDKATKGFLSENIVFPIGIKVDHDTVIESLNKAVKDGLITPEERAKIKGYRIVRGNRAGHQSIIAKGLIYDMNKYEKDSAVHYYPNYPYNDVRPDIFLSPDAGTYLRGNNSEPTPMGFSVTGRYTFHSPNTHFSNPTGGNFIKLETEEIGLSEGYFNKCEEQANYKILSTVSRTLCFGTGIAAAMASITKTCRTIEKPFSKTAIYGTVPGVIATTPGFLPEYTNLSPNPADHVRMGGLGSPSFIAPIGSKINEQDCIGTTYQWLSPGHLPLLGARHPTMSVIMGAVLAIGGGVSNLLYLWTLALQEMEIFANLLKSLIPNENFAIQYNSVGKYNDYKIVPNNGNKIRKLDAFTYLSPRVETVSEGTSSVRINNWHRESSVYLKTDGSKPIFPVPSVQDNSRVSMDSAGLEYGDLGKRFNRDISSYYASIKNGAFDQYGSIYSIDYLETGNCTILLNEAPQAYDTYFGGDTFINRMALKRKHPFFLQTRFRQLNQADVLYSELGNAAYPNYYIDIGESFMAKLGQFDIGDIFDNIGAFAQDLVGTDDTRLDAKRQKFFYQKGYIHLYNYGIPYFLCESDVNVDYRHGENDEEKDFYPHQSNLDYWLQEKNVPMTFDNYYFYNRSYSRQNKESSIRTIKPTFKFNDEAEVTHDNTLVYTDKSKTLDEGDNWLILRGNNFHKTDLSHGKIVSIDGIENSKVLIRSENASQIFGAYDTLKTESSTIQVDKGGLFANAPQDFSITDLGYMGSQHRDIIKSEFGHLWTDAKRGQIFLLSAGGKDVDELSKYGMRNWFKQNLPFNITKDINNIEPRYLDNNFKGIGLHLGFDKRFNRFFITKLDYKVIDKNIKFIDGNFVIVTGTNKWGDLITQPVTLGDPKYFINKSWTISFNILTKGWVSYHSFVPNFYVDHVDYFQTGFEDKVWSHGITNKSYQVYYGKICPFTVDILSEPSPVTSYINSIEYVADVLRYHNQHDWFYNRIITFNKAIVYNERQNSGILHLIPKDEDDFSTVGVYPKVVGNSTEIEVSNSENVWGFNEFYDMVNCQLNNVPIWTNDVNNVDKKLNAKAFDFTKDEFDLARLRSRVCHVRLTNDKWSNYKFIFFLNQFNQNRSFR